MTQTTPKPAPVLQANQDWTTDARFYEYTAAADPKVPGIPYAAYPSSLHAQGPTREIPFDLSETLQCSGPATTPNLLASFIKIMPGDKITTEVLATSELFYVIKGRGRSSCEHGTIAWGEGDIFVLPATQRVVHEATHETSIYHVHDAPLLRYLGVVPSAPRFSPTLFRRERLFQELNAVANQPMAELRNRRGIILGTAAAAQTLTITHTLWSLLNVLPANTVQKPHRHNSVALDLCIDAGPNTYTMIGKKLDKDKRVADGIKAMWLPGAAFVTPPGWWHSHHNESNKDALVLPIQDAGLCTYMRLLDIQFA